MGDHLGIRGVDVCFLVIVWHSQTSFKGHGEDKGDFRFIVDAQGYLRVCKHSYGVLGLLGVLHVEEQASGPVRAPDSSRKGSESISD